MRLFYKREFHNPLAEVDLTHIQIPVRIRIDVVHMVKFACIMAAVTERTHHGAVAPTEDPDHVVLSVGYEQVLLAWIMREGKVIAGPLADRLSADEEFLLERAFLCENLNPVGRSIAN